MLYELRMYVCLLAGGSSSFSGSCILREVDLIPRAGSGAVTTYTATAYELCRRCVAVECGSSTHMFWKHHGHIAGLHCDCGAGLLAHSILGGERESQNRLFCYKDSVDFRCKTSNPLVTLSDSPATLLHHLTGYAALQALVNSSAATDKLILVQFGEPWCPFCRLASYCLSRSFEDVRIQEVVGDRLLCCSVDLMSSGAEIARELQVPEDLPIPYFAVFKDARQITLRGQATLHKTRDRVCEVRHGLIVGSGIVVRNLDLLIERLLECVAEGKYTIML
ncbi:hypothetical protein CYMTET_22648 [Cymbomonas tetramitiformis]|uniref:Thioredoxin domain-containing protein n=1 Tax=Cymbomonas tetramitiformis TaxID=36881 RepID=A0AAE0G017_9CHLO|nr:hypothetical protein CYMTET_22648 [Cymbomonas tetramitiformis]